MKRLAKVLLSLAIYCLIVWQLADPYSNGTENLAIGYLYLVSILGIFVFVSSMLTDTNRPLPELTIPRSISTFLSIFMIGLLVYLGYIVLPILYAISSVLIYLLYDTAGSK